MSAGFALSLTGRGSRGVYRAVRGLSTALQQTSPHISNIAKTVGVQSTDKVMPTMAPQKIGGRASWKAADLANNPCWGIQLTNDELAELDAALQYSKNAPTPIEWEEDGVSRIPLNVSPKNFPLDKMAKRVEALSEEVWWRKASNPAFRASSERAEFEPMFYDSSSTARAP